MSGFAVAAVKGAVASALGASVAAPVAASAIDGFAVGALLSGLCLVLAVAPRRVFRRSRQRARDGHWPNAAHNPMTPNLSGYVPVTPYRSTATISDLPADESGEMPISLPNPRSNGRHRSSHAFVPERRPEAKRGSGRHAARPGAAGVRAVSEPRAEAR